MSLVKLDVLETETMIYTYISKLHANAFSSATLRIINYFKLGIVTTTPKD